MEDTISNRTTGQQLPPLMCSMGGIPFNKAHIDALRIELDDAREQLRKWQQASAADRAENERLRAALREIVSLDGKYDLPNAWGIARRTLEQKAGKT